MTNKYKLTFVRRTVNSLVKTAVNAGVGSKRTQLLSVRGRTSGTWHTTPVNLVFRDEHRATSLRRMANGTG